MTRSSSGHDQGQGVYAWPEGAQRRATTARLLVAARGSADIIERVRELLRKAPGMNGEAKAGEAGGGSKLAVYYNGSCPVCRGEIEHYQRQPATRDAVRWVDIAVEPLEGHPPRLDGEAGFRRLHAVDADGELRAGLDAFIAIWEVIPRYRPLARALRRPALRRLAEPIYERILAPLLFALHQRRQRRAA